MEKWIPLTLGLSLLLLGRAVLVFGQEGTAAGTPERSAVGPEVVLESVQLYQPNEEGLQMFWIDTGDHLPTISLRHFENVFSIQFYATRAGSEEPMYSWKMDGLTSHWTGPDPSGRVTFAHLRPGNYIFQVRTGDGAGRWGHAKILKIRIAPPWWATPLAYFGFVLLSLGFLFVLRSSLPQLLNKLAILLGWPQKLREFYFTYVPAESRTTLLQKRETEFTQALEQFVLEKVREENLSVQDLCRFAGMSRTSLYMKLKEMTGLSPQNFIIHTRLKYARQLFEEQHLNIKEVAYLAGFANPKHFSTSFKKVFGESPSAFLKRKENE